MYLPLREETFGLEKECVRKTAGRIDTALSWYRFVYSAV